MLNTSKRSSSGSPYAEIGCTIMTEEKGSTHHTPASITIPSSLAPKSEPTEPMAGTSASHVCKQHTACIGILYIPARLRLRMLRWIVGLEEIGLVEFARNLVVLRVFTSLSCQTAPPPSRPSQALFKPRPPIIHSCIAPRNERLNESKRQDKSQEDTYRSSLVSCLTSVPPLIAGAHPGNFRSFQTR